MEELFVVFAVISGLISLTISVVIYTCIIVIALSLWRIHKQLDEGIGTYELTFTSTGQKIRPFRNQADQYRLYSIDEWASYTGMTNDQTKEAVEQGRLETRESEGQIYIVPPRG